MVVLVLVLLLAARNQKFPILNLHAAICKMNGQFHWIGHKRKYVFFSLFRSLSVFFVLFWLCGFFLLFAGHDFRLVEQLIFLQTPVKLTINAIWLNPKTIQFNQANCCNTWLCRNSITFVQFCLGTFKLNTQINKCFAKYSRGQH